MKNLKIYKSALALLTATSIFLLSGCSDTSNKEKKEEPCTHLTVYFEDKPVTFKECEGYYIDVDTYHKESDIDYTIKKDGKNILSGTTVLYNILNVYHSEADKILEDNSIQKTK